MDLSDLRQTLLEMTDEELQQTLQGIRQNRRTPVKTIAKDKAKAETKASANSKKAGEPSLEALLASASNNPDAKAKLLAALLGGK